MVVLDTLDDAVALLRRHPKLFAGLFVASVAANLTNSGRVFGLAGAERWGLRIVEWVVGPAIAVGTVGLIDATATDGDASVGAFAAAVRRYYIEWVVAIVLMGITAILAAFLFFVLFQIPLLGLVAGFAFVVLVLVAVLTLQFVDVAIVVDGDGPLEGIGRSYEVAMSNFGSVVGYTLLEAVLLFVVLLPLLVAVAATGWPESLEALEPTPALLAAATLTVAGSTVVQTWRVLFYRRLRDLTIRRSSRS